MRPVSQTNSSETATSYKGIMYTNHDSMKYS